MRLLPRGPTLYDLDQTLFYEESKDTLDRIKKTLETLEKENGHV